MIAKLSYRELSRSEGYGQFSDARTHNRAHRSGEAGHGIAPATAKETYREFARGEPSLPMFSRDWWLDATAGSDAWNVVIVKKDGQVVAAMPYMIRRFGWLKILGQPPLTQKLGPWFRPGEGKTATRLAAEKELMQGLIEQFPQFDHFTQNWHYGCTNWLPFAWNGFRQTTRYTYVLDDLSDLDRLWSGFRHNIRSECRKASHRFRLQVRDDLPIDAFLALNRMTFERQRISSPYSESFVRRLDAACAARACRKCFVAVDQQGRHHAGVYIAWDESSSYGLMTGSDPALRTSGAVSLCFWEAIRHAARVTRRFDFGGSMLQPVERFFRGFGAVQMPYFHIAKTPSLLLRGREGVLSVIRGQ
jgi:hypothetical protein